MTDAPFATGGCNCGAVRYALKAKPARSELCHCRSCRRALGNVVAAFADVRRADLEWLLGAPAIYASSPGVRRGFCRDCGTPLSFEKDGEPYIAVTIGSLDDPELAPIDGHCGVQGKLSWIRLCDGLPERRSGEPPAAQIRED